VLFGSIDIGVPKAKCIAVLGIRGSGKSNTAKVVVENLISSGVPVTIIDPDGEYVDEVLRRGGEVVDKFDDDPMEAAISDHRANRSVVLNLGEWSEEVFDYSMRYLQSTWDVSRVSPRYRTVVVEEAHEFVPQGRGNALSEVLIRMGLRGRKRGLGLMLISQRSAKVNKDILTQSEVYFLHRVIHPADLRIYKEIVPLPPREVDRVFPTLATGEAIVYYEGKVERVRLELFEEVNGRKDMEVEI